MGAGITLDNNQIADIIIRQLIDQFYDEQRTQPLYTEDGYEIYHDFSDEVALNKRINEIYLYCCNKQLKNGVNHKTG